MSQDKKWTFDSREFDRTIRKFKKELKSTVEEQNYPYVKSLLDTMLVMVKGYPEREKEYDELGFNKET